MAISFTESAINKAAREVRETGKQRDLYDAGFRGLMIRLTPGGARTFNLSCRDVTGKARRFPLGPFPSMSISEARKAAHTLHMQIRTGADPAKERAKVRNMHADARAGIGTLRSLLDEYGAARGQQLRSWPDCRRRISHVFQAYLDSPLQALSRTELQSAADKHPAKQAAAAAVRYVRPVLAWAAKRGLADATAAELDQPAKVQQRERVLTDVELAAIWRATEAAQVPTTFGKLVRLLILTGQRRDEVAEMRWSELSPDRETWTLPGHRMKNKAAQVVPLSEPARAILPAEAGDGLVFAGQRDTAFSGWSKAKAALDKTSGVNDWRIHDIRRTVATGLQRLGVRLEVTEAVLGHVAGSRGGIVGVYQRHTWAEEKKAALVAWADFVAKTVNARAAGA